MENNGSPNFGVHLRSIEDDDIEGLQFLYGAVHPFKPVLETYEFTGPGRIRITGENFDDFDNEIWFTPEAPTLPMMDPVIRVGAVASSAGGTTIELDIPAGAGPGSVAVRIPGMRSMALSNVFPFDPQLEPWAAPTAYGQPGMTSTGTSAEITWSGLPSASIEAFHVGVEGAGAAPYALLVEGDARGARSTAYGTLLLAGQVRRRTMIALNGGAGETTLPFIPTGMIGDSSFYQVWVPDGGAPAGGVFTDALQVTLSR